MTKKKKFPYAQNKPFILKTSPGRYAWCSCGEAKSQPFCDGRHEETGLYPVIETVTEEKTIAWCGCKATSNPPYCDGSHAKLS